MGGAEMDSLKRLSHYKAHMMGIAVMIVVYGHLLYYHGDLINYEDNHWTEWYTLGSVEMFIFLSGFGIYQSLRRNREPWQFYQKRLSRLFPSYLPVMLAWCALNVFKGKMRLSNAMGNLTGMGWWFQTDHQFNWYVPAILVLYLISPLLFDCLEKKKTGWGFGALILLNLAGWRSNLLMALSRFPTYFMGMWYGKRYAEGRVPSRREQAIWFAVGAVAMALVPYFFLIGRRYLWYYGMYWYLFCPAAPLWMFGISKLLELQDKIAPGRVLNKIWSFLGVRSFEIYLCHLALYDTMLKLHVHGWPQWICIAAAGTGIGIAFHEVVEWCLRKWNSRKTASAA